MSDPRFRQRASATLDSRFLPDWTADAACTGMARRQPGGVVWRKAFSDELAQSHDEYEWAADTLEVMRTCAGCPVRRACIAYAYDSEVMHPETWWAEEEAPEPEEAKRRFGVYGGIPGRMRERFAPHPDRIERGEAWLAEQARQHGWDITEREEGAA